MLYNIYDKIELINNYGYNFKLQNYSQLVINSDIETLTDTCIITIPNKNVILTKNYIIPKSNVNSAEDFYLRITVGSKIEVYLDYYANNDQLKEIESITDSIKEDAKKVFIGYVARFDIGEDSIDIVCEDANYLFKHKRLKNSWDYKAIDITKNTISNYNGPVLSDNTIINRKVMLLDIIQWIVWNSDSVERDTSFINLRVPEIEIGQFIIKDSSTGAEIFNTLKEDYKLFIYFTIEWNEEAGRMLTYLNAGLKYNISNVTLTSKATYHYPYNIKYYPIIESNLEIDTFDKSKDLSVIGSSKQYVNDTSIILGTLDGINVVEDISKLKQPTSTDKFVSNELKEAYKLQVKNNSVPLKSIENRPTRIELNLPNLSKEELKKYVLSTWNNYPTAGYKGEFTTFLKPIIRIGDIITVKIENSLEVITEEHYVDSVNITLDANSGLTQIITLGLKL